MANFIVENFDFNSNSTPDYVGNVSKQPVQLQSWTDFLYRLQFDTKTLGPANLCYFFEQRWTISIYYAVAYLILVFLGHNWMKSRKPYHLRTALGIWSGMLSVFSIVGSIYVWPEFIRVLWNKGFVGTYCDNSFADNHDVFYWYTLFTLSKIPELIDTGFIVLRKQKLIMLHWIHHALTLVFTFYVFSDQIGTARWMVSMNFIVHAFMYGYYCLKAFHVNISRKVSIAITTSQIVQMIFGFGIHSHSLLLQIMGNDAGCQCTFRTSLAGFLMYLLYFYFFVEFFVKAYLSNKKQSTTKPSMTNGTTNGVINGVTNGTTMLNKCSDSDNHYSDSNNNVHNNGNNYAQYCNGTEQCNNNSESKKTN